MTDIIEPAAPPKPEDKPTEPKAPETPPGQAPTGDDIPEKFKGKTAAEIAKSYVELEKVHGKNSEEVSAARKELEDWKALGKVIGGKKELREAVKAEIDRLSGKAADPEKPEEPKQPDSTTQAVQDGIINKFETDRGLHLLDKEKKVELNKKIGRELVDMLDPTGTKTPSEILAMIPTNRLPQYLDKAYKLATADDKEERTRAAEFIAAQENRQAIIGSMPSSGVNGGAVQLTPGQKEAARRMNISEEDYIKQIKEIEKENK